MRLFHCPCIPSCAENVFTVSRFIILILELLDEDYCYEELYTECSLLVTCKKHLTDAFVFDPFLWLHYYKRKHFIFYNTLGSKAHLQGCKIVTCYVCYRK